MLKITIVVKDLSDTWWKSLEDMPLVERLKYLMDKARPYSGLNDRIKVKIGTGQFRDAVEFNALKRAPMDIEMIEGKRRGYTLLTFNVKAS